MFYVTINITVMEVISMQEIRKQTLKSASINQFYGSDTLMTSSPLATLPLTTRKYTQQHTGSPVEQKTASGSLAFSMF